MRYKEFREDFNSTKTSIEIEKFVSLTDNTYSFKIFAKGHDREKAIQNAKSRIDAAIKSLNSLKDNL